MSTMRYKLGRDCSTPYFTQHDFREPVKTSVENSTWGGEGTDQVIFHTYFPKKINKLCLKCILSHFRPSFIWKGGGADPSVEFSTLFLDGFPYTMSYIIYFYLLFNHIAGESGG